MTEQKTRFSMPMAFFWLLSLNRTVMVAMITGTAAFVAGAGVANSLLMTLAGWCLAVGGFRQVANRANLGALYAYSHKV